jgi:dCMP deaminase
VTRDPQWDDYFSMFAEITATRADCRRRRFGAVLVKDNRIIATGYNGTVPGRRGCLDGGCPRGLASFEEVPPFSPYDAGAGSCIAIHAEDNALRYTRYGEAEGATLYLWTNEGECKPCDRCAVLLIEAGVTRWHCRSGTSLIRVA